MNIINLILVAGIGFTVGAIFVSLINQKTNDTNFYGNVETQHYMTETQHKQETVFIDYEKFVNKFKTKRWYIQKKYKGSFFNESHWTNQIHAGVWVIDNVGFLAINQKEYEKIKKFLNTTWETLDTLGLWGIGELA